MSPSKTVIRFELQLKKELQSKLGFYPSIKNLLIEKNFNYLSSILIESYYQIEKQSSKIINPEICNNRKNIKDAIYLLSIDSFGTDNFINTLDSYRKIGLLSKQTINGYKLLIKKKELFLQKSDHVKEMDDEFERVMNLNRI